MKKAAIVTLYDNINIGNKLQNYAIQVLLEKYYGIVETLSYKEAFLNSKRIGLKGKIALKLGFPPSIAKEKKTILMRRKRIELFSDKFLNVKEDKSFIEYTSSFSDNYDAFFVGSDQVWHNWTKTKEEMDYFFLRFVPKNKRICISPSFGYEELPDEYTDSFKNGLNGFYYLSCREQSGCDIIESLTGRKAERLLDPTMILSVDQWDLISQKPPYDVPNKYILVYCLGKKEQSFYSSIEKISKELNIPVIDIFNLNKLEYYCTSPDEFIYLIKNAELVCTNSFHGCAFSILYNKKIALLERPDQEGKKMKGRLDSLFDTFNISRKERIISYSDAKVEKTLNEERKKFNTYLNKCISALDR